MRTMIIAAMAASVALSGCTNNPYTNQSQASKAAWGAGIGVLTGAALGAATSFKGRSDWWCCWRWCGCLYGRARKEIAREITR